MTLQKVLTRQRACFTQTVPYPDHEEGNPRTETQKAWLSERGSPKIFLKAFLFPGIREGKRVDATGGNVVTSCLFCAKSPTTINIQVTCLLFTALFS